MAYNGDWSVWPVLGFGVGLTIFLRGFKVYRECLVVEDTPHIPIRSIPMGMVNIKGRAAGEQRVWSPVTHTPCYFYKVHMERAKQASHGSSWSRFGMDMGGVKFYLEDGSGRVAIDARAAEFDVAKTGQREVSPREVQGSLSDAMAQVVLGGREVSGAATNSLQPDGGATDDELRYYVNRAAGKRVLEFVERLSEATGSRLREQESMGDRAPKPLAFFRTFQALRNPDKLKHALEQPLAGEESPEKMAAFMGALMQKNPQTRLEDPSDPEAEQKRAKQRETMQQLISHPEMAFAPETGRFRLTEYCIVPGREYTVIGTCVENRAAKDEHDRNLIVKGTNEPTYVISDKGHVGVQGSLRGRAVMKVLVGSVVAFVSLTILLVRLGLL